MDQTQINLAVSSDYFFHQHEVPDFPEPLCFSTRFIKPHLPLIKQADSIEHISAGGCGIHVLALYRYFKKFLDTYYAIVLCHHWDSDSIEKNFKKYSKGKKFEVPSHMMLQVGEYILHYDDIVHENDFYSGYDYEGHESWEFNEEALLKRINTKTGWNPMFNRKVGIPRLELLLGVSLDDVIK